MVDARHECGLLVGIYVGWTRIMAHTEKMSKMLTLACKNSYIRMRTWWRKNLVAESRIEVLGRHERVWDDANDSDARVHIGIVPEV